MISIHPAAANYSYDHGWLRGSFCFSFGPYYDPDNAGFGPLRVCNHDTIAPGRGFGAHPHSDMEIVSIVLSGSLQHEDNLGHVAVTGFGEVQRMTAGTGVIHTEGNPSSSEDVSLLQLWFEPDRRGLEPGYETSRFEPERMADNLLPVVSGRPAPGVAFIHQDMTIYLSRLNAARSVEFVQAEGRRMFLYVVEGALRAGNLESELGAGDSARIEGTARLELTASANTFLMLIDLP